MPEALDEKRAYARKIRNQIKAGILPRYFFVKGKDDKLERKPGKRGKMKLTWKMRSTYHELTK